MAEKRIELGSAHVAECWKRGMAGEAGWFFAREGALAIGTPWDVWADVAFWQASASQAIVIMRDPVVEVQHGA